MEDARDSLFEFQSSIFDASDGHQLVDFIRKKKGLRSQPQKIFDDVRTDRQSLQIEIQRLNDSENTKRPEESNAPAGADVVDNTIQPNVEETTNVTGNIKSPRKSAFIDSKLKLKRLSHSIGRRTLLKEFERTLQDSRFLPPTCSTPLSAGSQNLPATPHTAVNEPTSSKATSVAQEKTLNLNVVCTPITISDDSPALSGRESAKENQISTENSNTENVMRQLQLQNDLLLALASPERAHTPFELRSPIREEEQPLRSPVRNSSTPTKESRRQTYTVHRDSTSGNLILSPHKSRKENDIRESTLPKTPLKNLHNNSRPLIVTPEQKKLLLSKFGRQATGSPQRVANVQKTSRIPIIMKGSTTNAPSADAGDLANSIHTYHDSEQRDTAQIIEQLQKRPPSSAPVIVIPVNQTFNQAPKDTSQSVVKSPTPVKRPIHNKKQYSPNRTSTPNRPHHKKSHVAPTPSTSMARLRSADIITEDESSSSEDNLPIATRSQSKERKAKTSLNTNSKQRPITRGVNKLDLVAPPPRTSSRNIRELLTPQQLSQLSVGDILDLRKRNSRGELRRTLNLTKRESSMFDKQVELELLRRNIQEKNYEDEVVQMEVIPPPPEEFCDPRKSLHKSTQLLAAPAVINDLIGESSSDRISLSQEPPLSHQSSTAYKGRPRKKKKMSEQLQKYLQASESVRKSKFLNLSKRKLYSKGLSENSSSNDDSSPTRSPPRRSSRNILSTPNAGRPVRSISNNSHQNQADAPRSASPTLSPPKEFANATKSIVNPNEAVEKQPFIPNDDVVFKKPVGKPKKRAQTNSALDRSRSQALLKKSKDNMTECAVPRSLPVDPDDVIKSNNVSMIRRSKRGQKPLKVFWSCTQKEYIPLYDICHLLPSKRNASEVKQKNRSSKKTAKNLSSSEDNLVANTKKPRTNSVDKAKSKKNTKKKNKEDKQDDGASNSNECPPSNICNASEVVEHTNSRPTQDHNPESSANVETTEVSESVPPLATSTITERPQSKSRSKKSNQSGEDTHASRGLRERPQSKSKSNKSHQADTPSEENIHTSRTMKKNAKSNSKSKKNHLPETPLEEDTHTNTIMEEGPQSRSKSKKRHLPENPTKEDTNAMKGCPQSKSKSKKRHLPKTSSEDDTLQLSNITNPSIRNIETPSTSKTNDEDNPPSYQQIRLETIAEDSLPHLSQQTTITVSDFDKTNKNRLSSTLMPPPPVPPSRLPPKKSKVSKKKDAFRTDHDASIADASSLHVNKLFDQLKNSSMCVAGEETIQGVATNSGQVSQRSRAKEPKCKNLTVKLMRMKARKTVPENNDKVCDSGFSSEDMSSDPQQRGDILLNWLKQIVRSGKSPSGSEKGVAKILQSDGFHAASADDLMFQEIDGVDYAFYNTKQKFSFGYMRFNPKTEKKQCKAKKYELNFIVLCGSVVITANGNAFDCKNGDLITVFIGTTYCIKNISNDPTLVMVIKK